MKRSTNGQGIYTLFHKAHQILPSKANQTIVQEEDS